MTILVNRFDAKSIFCETPVLENNNLAMAELFLEFLIALITFRNTIGEMSEKG